MFNIFIKCQLFLFNLSSALKMFLKTYRIICPCYPNACLTNTSLDILSGHFVQFSDWSNNNNGYTSRTLRSPYDTFLEDGCITFWYYLNGSATQPHALSAQIVVSLQYGVSTEYLWYVSTTVLHQNCHYRLYIKHKITT